MTGDVKVEKTNNQDFLLELEKILEPYYRPGQIAGGHDVEHVRRMVSMGFTIAAGIPSLTFNQEEYRASVWLHNLDRVPEFKRFLESTSPQQVIGNFLQSSNFDEEAKLRIADAVIQHPKKDDDPKDSCLLTALRIADKLDRLNLLGVISAVAHRSTLFIYDPRQPFGYNSTEEGRLKSIYNDFMRVLEWVGMLPSDEARALIVPEDFAAYIAFLRALGALLSRVCNVENRIEDDLQKALGEYYTKYA